MKIFIAIPALAESNYLPDTIECIKNQTFKNHKTLVCINNPESWQDLPEKKNLIDDNKKTNEYLKTIDDIDIEIIDRFSKGKGLLAKDKGVGTARKILFDKILEVASDNDIIISLDADTLFDSDYFDNVIKRFKSNPDAIALSVPYKHRVDNKSSERAILRYEIYMRTYLINMLSIKTPYAFTALGSAIAVKVGAVRKISGITPRSSGEDFYLLQKLAKTGRILLHCDSRVYPSNRKSSRVDFGTGPAVIKGETGDFSSYPIFDVKYFEEVGKTIELFSEKFDKNIDTPMDKFLVGQFKNLWEPLRKNYKMKHQFIKACHTKIDGLRILQYLRTRQIEERRGDDDNLMSFFKKFMPSSPFIGSVNLTQSSIGELSLVCNEIEEIELLLRQERDKNRLSIYSRSR